MDNFNIPEFLRRQASSDFDSKTSPRELIEMFNRIALSTNSYEEALDYVLANVHGDSVRKVIVELERLIGDRYRALTILLFWISEPRMLEECRLQRHALRLLDASFNNGITPDVIKTGYEYLLANLGSISKDGWSVEEQLEAMRPI